MRRKSIKRCGFGGISDSAKNIGILISIATVLVVAILGGGSLYKNSKMKKMRKSILESAARGGLPRRGCSRRAGCDIRGNSP